jgi:hypothetical protein
VAASPFSSPHQVDRDEEDGAASGSFSSHNVSQVQIIF